jgi:hypothetical protein
MKHHSHIYVAKKSIEFMYDALNNLYYPSGRAVGKDRRSELRRKGKTLQRLLYYHSDSITEASWAPDDILGDKARFHTFKLFTRSEFADYERFAKETHVKARKKYYRTTGGGGLPYRVDHLAQVIRDMMKLRNYNDSYSMKQIMYQFFLISHYVVDAHVPMHCDIRDDEPSSSKPSEGLYYDTGWHGRIEERWEQACTPVGIAENILERERAQDSIRTTELSPSVTFDLGTAAHCEQMKTYDIESNKLMKFMIDLCIQSKERGLELFPADNPNNFREGRFSDLTREIFSSSIGNLISVWISMWEEL